MRAALLLADPDPAKPGYLERNLSSDGFDVVVAGWSAQALDIAERSRPDIVLAGETDLCARLREGEPGRRWDRNVPVIVLTATGADPVDRVRAFERGADDVVERDLYQELVARIHAVLRRAAAGPADLLEAGELVVDRRARQVRVRGFPSRSPASSSISWCSSRAIGKGCQVLHCNISCDSLLQDVTPRLPTANVHECKT